MGGRKSCPTSNLSCPAAECPPFRCVMLTGRSGLCCWPAAQLRRLWTLCAAKLMVRWLTACSGTQTIIKGAGLTPLLCVSLLKREWSQLHRLHTVFKSFLGLHRMGFYFPNDRDGINFIKLYMTIMINSQKQCSILGNTLPVSN